MIYRIMAVLICTTLSFYGVFLSFGGAVNIFTCIAEGTCKFEYNAKGAFVIVSTLILCTAWLFYFAICYRWIMDLPVRKKTRIIGATLGCICILLTAGVGLFFTFLSVGLMIHIYRTAPYK
jgi:hypothetical protein